MARSGSFSAARGPLRSSSATDAATEDATEVTMPNEAVSVSCSRSFRGMTGNLQEEWREVVLPGSRHGDTRVKRGVAHVPWGHESTRPAGPATRLLRGRRPGRSDRGAGAGSLRRTDLRP